MLWPLKNTNGRLAIPALAGLLVHLPDVYGQLTAGVVDKRRIPLGAKRQVWRNLRSTARINLRRAEPSISCLLAWCESGARVRLIWADVSLLRLRL